MTEAEWPWKAYHILDLYVEYASRLKELIEQIALDIGVEALEHSLFSAGNRKILRIFIDKEGGVTVQDCSKLSRELGAALDLEDLLPFAYVLEVSSPGLDRPLKTERDFLRQKGRLIKVQLSEPDAVLGRKVIGEMVDASETTVTLSVAGAETVIPLANILVAKVEVDI